MVCIMALKLKGNQLKILIGFGGYTEPFNVMSFFLRVGNSFRILWLLQSFQ